MTKAMHRKVIIPSAKIVPEELQKLGKLPGIIFPINQKIVFDYLYEQYKNICTSIDIICYEMADKVQRRLGRYVGDKVKIILLNKLSDLGHTIYHSICNVNEPIIINFADTIVLDNLYDISVDAFFCKEAYMSEKWTFFEEKDGVITDIFDKKSVICWCISNNKYCILQTMP